MISASIFIKTNFIRVLFTSFFILVSCLSTTDYTFYPPTEEVNFEEIQTELQRIVNDVENGDYGKTNSLIIYKNDKLLIQEYFNNWDKEDLHFQYSVTKSITSVLIGIAINKGYIKSENERLMSFFPEYLASNEITSEQSKITITDLLSMRAGFKWDEWTYSYTDTRNDANRLIRSDDMIKFMLDLAMDFSPGEKFTYNSGCSMLLSAILERTTQMPVELFAEEYLFKEMGITKWKWEQAKDGLFNTGWGLHLRPIDMLQIGKLYLSNGQFKGKQIISENWIGKSSFDYGNNYGFHWWLSNNGEIISARGWGGQYIFCLLYTSDAADD